MFIADYFIIGTIGAALVIVMCIIIALAIDAKKSHDRNKAKAMIREAQRRG